MTEMEDGSALDCVACGGYVSIERLKQLPLCAGCEDREPCRCVMTDRGSAGAAPTASEAGARSWPRPPAWPRWKA